MSGGPVAACGRLRRGSIFAKMKGSSAPHSNPGLAIRSTVQGFTSGGHRDSSLYRHANMVGRD